MKILVINGPNLNLLGTREPQIYGTRTYAQLEDFIASCARESGLEVAIFQSNHEGAIVDKIQEAMGRYDAIVLNAAAYTHTSLAILDALRAVRLPCVEVHLSAVESRETFRRFSYISLYACACFSGTGFEAYRSALAYLARL